MPTWDDIKGAALKEGLPPHIIAAEPLQIAFLDGFYGEKDALDIVFHGGTSIRLLHGGYRYSEDLDFCIPSSFDIDLLNNIVERAYEHAKSLVALYLGGAETEIKRKEGRKKIPTWWFNALPSGGRQKYRVKIEFGRYPAYAKLPLPVTVKNEFIPRHPVVISTDAKELLADKMNAVSDRPYTKERDFFDIWYLVKALQCPFDIGLFQKKLADYGSKHPKAVLEKRLAELDARTLAANMENFLPAQYRALLSQNNYREVIDCCRDAINAALKGLQ